MKKTTIFALLMLFIWACRKEDAPVVVVDPPFDPFSVVSEHLNISKKAPDFSFSLPIWLREYQPTIPANNNIIELGRVIFYDKKLSADGKIACASCHHQGHAFSDIVPLSTGVNGKKTKRNSMALTNNISFGGVMGMLDTGTTLYPLFWDSRALSIQAQSKAAFTNPLEMDISMSKVVSTVAEQPYYPWLFERAFGDSVVTESRILLSIAHFLNNLHTYNSKFDRAMQVHTANGGTTDLDVTLTGLTVEENQGKALYVAHCNNCHSGLNNVRGIFEANNGLESPYIDKGKNLISGHFFDIGVFRVPMLRNIAYSAPYMHDGRFTTLEQVIEHYNSGVIKGYGLHGELLQLDEATQTYSAKRLNLTEAEKAALKAFLLTLSDESVLTDQRYADPFK
jgi:cytochrome c peroxidase